MTYSYEFRNGQLVALEDHQTPLGYEWEDYSAAIEAAGFTKYGSSYGDGGGSTWVTLHFAEKALPRDVWPFEFFFDITVDSRCFEVFCRTFADAMTFLSQYVAPIALMAALDSLREDAEEVLSAKASRTREERMRRDRAAGYCRPLTQEQLAKQTEKEEQARAKERVKFADHIARTRAELAKAAEEAHE